MEYKEFFKASLPRLLEALDITYEDSFEWNEGEKIYLDDIRQAHENGVAGDATPYGDTWRHPALERRDRKYHIARVIYFMEHQEEIDGIEVTTKGVHGFMLPALDIVDGSHRLLAAMKLGLPYVNIDFSGCCDILDYITEDCDEMLGEIL